MPDMGKANRWIRNFLMGKKERDSKDEGSVSVGSLGTSPVILPSSSKPRRRWCFKRSSSSDNITTHNNIRSFDSVLTSQITAQASLLEFEILQSHAKAFLAAKTADSMKPVEVEAAIRIQAALCGMFSCYKKWVYDTKMRGNILPCRKALRALRSLVKLQALVRGHLQKVGWKAKKCHKRFKKTTKHIM